LRTLPPSELAHIFIASAGGTGDNWQMVQRRSTVGGDGLIAVSGEFTWADGVQAGGSLGT
jgi:hypothetical protein